MAMYRNRSGDYDPPSDPQICLSPDLDLNTLVLEAEIDLETLSLNTTLFGPVETSHIEGVYFEIRTLVGQRMNNASTPPIMACKSRHTDTNCVKLQNWGEEKGVGVHLCLYSGAICRVARSGALSSDPGIRDVQPYHLGK
ncbi:unnamed protein product, partial [Iphiclides podalirius]